MSDPKLESVSAVRMFLYAIALVLILGFLKTACAEEQMKTITESDFIFYMNTMDEQDQKIKKLHVLIKDQNGLFEDMLKSSKLREENAKLNENVIIANDKKIIARQAEDMRYMDKRIQMYRDEVEQLESKGTKDRIGKLGTVATDTASGCLTGSLFAGVGAVPGCAIGFIIGITKSFVSDMM